MFWTIVGAIVISMIILSILGIILYVALELWPITLVGILFLGFLALLFFFPKIGIIICIIFNFLFWPCVIYEKITKKPVIKNLSLLKHLN